MRSRRLKSFLFMVLPSLGIGPQCVMHYVQGCGRGEGAHPHPRPGGHLLVRIHSLLTQIHAVDGVWLPTDMALLGIGAMVVVEDSGWRFVIPDIEDGLEGFHASFMIEGREKRLAKFAIVARILRHPVLVGLGGSTLTPNAPEGVGGL